MPDALEYAPLGPAVEKLEMAFLARNMNFLLLDLMVSVLEEVVEELIEHQELLMLHTFFCMPRAYYACLDLTVPVAVVFVPM